MTLSILYTNKYFTITTEIIQCFSELKNITIYIILDKGHRARQLFSSYMITDNTY